MIRRRSFSALLRDIGGTSVVEFALITPALLVVLGGVIDGSRLLVDKLALQQAADRAIGMASIGGVASGAFAQIQAEAASAAGVPSSNVTVSYWLECDGVRQDMFNANCASGQQVGRFASVTIAGSYTPIFPWSAIAANAQGGSIAISGDASVRVQ